MGRHVRVGSRMAQREPVARIEVSLPMDRQECANCGLMHRSITPTWPALRLIRLVCSRSDGRRIREIVDEQASPTCEGIVERESLAAGLGGLDAETDHLGAIAWPLHIYHVDKSFHDSHAAHRAFLGGIARGVMHQANPDCASAVISIASCSRAKRAGVNPAGAPGRRIPKTVTARSRRAALP
jgi:hypothetical protein